MIEARRRICPTAVLASLFLTALGPTTTQAQNFATTRASLSEAIYLPEADSTIRAHLERVQAFREARQWHEVVETLRQVMEGHDGQLIQLTDDRWISVLAYCHLQLSQLPEAALAIYREQVDPQARRWFEQGIEHRDRQSLLDVIEQHFCSSWGDDALYALGELSIEQGDFGLARAYLRQLVSTPPGLLADAPPRMAYPDANIDLAEIGARLILCSIFEGSMSRAQRELEQFRRAPQPGEPPTAAGHRDAIGTIAGREVNLGEALASLLEASPLWAAPRAGEGWSTFAGNMHRDRVAQPLSGGIVWQWEHELPKVPILEASVARNFGFRPSRVAEDHASLLSYHPVIYDDLVLVNNEMHVFAFNFRTGQPPWGLDDPLIFHDEEAASSRGGYRNALGAPRYTMTVADDKLYVRMGSMITSGGGELTARRTRGYLLCLDLRAQARVVWKIVPEDSRWSFEGAPCVVGNDVYVAARHSDVQHPRAHVECYDARTGRKKWRQFVCGSDTVGHNQLAESTHALLTVHRDTIYFNTNLGAVAALRASDGRLKWVYQYRRATGDDLSAQAAHFYRDLTPCVYHSGQLFVAPSDSPSILALDAVTGQRIWENALAEDAIHLLGVGAGQLIASGDRLYWFSIEQEGKLVARWPEGDSPRGFGRGVLSGDRVLWPTRESIYIFNQADHRWTGEIPLADHRRAVDGSNLNGGNLMVIDDMLFIAESDKLVALSAGKTQRTAEANVTPVLQSR